MATVYSKTDGFSRMPYIIIAWSSINRSWLRSVSFSVKWSRVLSTGHFPWATSMSSSVWASDVTEWCSFNWHWVIRYSDRVSGLRQTLETSSSPHSGLTIRVRAVNETMSSSINWIISPYISTLLMWFSAINSVSMFCVDNCRHRR